MLRRLFVVTTVTLAIVFMSIKLSGQREKSQPLWISNVKDYSKMSQFVTQNPSPAPGTIYKVERTDEHHVSDYGTYFGFVSVAHTPLILEEQIKEVFFEDPEHLIADTGQILSGNDIRVTVLGIALPDSPSGVVLQVPIE
jgi:hypothetical protein